ncbi:MAG TPA: PH domain-containing protein [Pilimelia sp.]|nr:PH domain-containing protein [Pilimelia sp.]
MTEPPAAVTGPPPGPLEPWPDTVAWKPVSGRLVWVELLQLASWVGFLLLGLLFAWYVSGSGFVAAAAAVLAVIAIVRAFAIGRAVRAWGYAERERDLLVRHGLLVRRLSIVPYARMQFVDVTAGPLERAFNLATVQLHTAAAASDARVPGLEPLAAARLRDRLTALGEDRAEGL